MLRGLSALLKNMEKERIVEARDKKRGVTGDMTFAEILSSNREAGVKLAERGMFCGGCPMAGLGTLEDGCRAHGVDIEEILGVLNGKK